MFVMLFALVIVAKAQDDAMIIIMKDGTTDTLLIKNIVKMDIDTIAVKVEDDNGPVLVETDLFRNYPNPVSESTTFEFFLENPSFAELRILDMTGKELFRQSMESAGSGVNSIQWKLNDNKGRKVAKGIYICEIKTKEYTAYKKIVVTE
jgi:flagellar hook assembly protein FlgD